MILKLKQLLTFFENTKLGDWFGQKYRYNL